MNEFMIYQWLHGNEYIEFVIWEFHVVRLHRVLVSHTLSINGLWFKDKKTN